MRTAFEPEGDVRSLDLPGAFATLWRQRASGVVTFSGPGRFVRFDRRGESGFDAPRYTAEFRELVGHG